MTAPRAACSAGSSTQYDFLGRMRGRVQRTDENCVATVADLDSVYAYAYDAQGRVQRVANDNVSRSFTYDSYSRLNRESVTVDRLTRASSYIYDDHHRPVAVTYPAGEVITTTYGSPGAAVGLSSSIHGALVDRVNYDEAGRMTALRFPAGGNLWRTQSYYPWTAKRNGGMLESLKVGLSEGGGERLSRGYAYNSFGDITSLTEGTTSNEFTYDGLGRLTGAYGRTYAYDGASRLTSFNGQSYGYDDSGPFHAVDRIGGADRFDYDANGNMTVRNKGLAGQQTLVWDAQNRLSQVQDNNGDLLEQYWYGVDGARVKKVSGTTTTYTFFAHYEEEVTGAVTTTVSHYRFGGLRFAVKRGGDLFHLHGDHLGSTSLTTDGAGAATASRAYYAYGAERSSSGDLKTDHTFTSQKRDATGLMYYNARYYDPALGTFISPDSMVPGTEQVINYNRFLYARGNPLKFTDPTGHAGYDPLGAAWVEEFKAAHDGRAPSQQDRKDRLVSLAVPGSGPRGSWRKPDWKAYTSAKVVGEYILKEIRTNAMNTEVLEPIGDAQILSKHFASLILGGQPDWSNIKGFIEAKIAAYILWAGLVGSDQDWDHKPIILGKGWGKWHPYKGYAYRYDIWSNIHFGYIARVIGFSDIEMLAGAGVAQIGDYLNPKKEGTFDIRWLLRSFGDDPYDAEAIRVGFALHAAVLEQGKLTSELFWDVFDGHAKNLARCPLSDVSPSCPAWEE